MSVAIIGPQELADAATLAALGAPEDARKLESFTPGVILVLAKFSEANVKAYRRSYVEGRDVVRFEDASVRPVTAAEIIEHVRTIPPAELVSSFLNLHYNAVAQDGTDFCDPTLARALEAVCAWAAAAKEQLEPLPEGRRSRKDPRHYGGKYDAAKSVTEIPALIRADIKAAIIRGELPPGKYSVRRRRSTHSWAIDVAIGPVGIRLFNPERLRIDRDDPHTYVDGHRVPYYTPEANAARKTVEAIVGAYNHDGSDSMTDYYDVRFYGSVDWDHDWERERRGLETAELPPREGRAV